MLRSLSRTHLRQEPQWRKAGSGTRRRTADGDPGTSSASISKGYKTVKCKRKVSATSHDENEARHVARGGSKALQRRIGDAADLGGDLGELGCSGWCSGRVWGLRGFGSVFKGRKSGEIGTPRANRARDSVAARVWLGHWVEDGSDRWVPPGSGTVHGTALSATTAKGRGGAHAGCPPGPRGGPCGRWLGRGEKERGGREIGRPRGERLGQARNREGEGISFSKLIL